jgi:hypothetical protein
MPIKDLKERRRYQREWMRKRRNLYFCDKVCTTCGSNENLELHHIDRTTKVNHCIWSWSVARQDDELEKCTVLCRNCHMEITKKQLSELQIKPFPHGVYSGYRKGCRCDKCKAIYKIHRKQWFLKSGK